MVKTRAGEVWRAIVHAVFRDRETGWTFTGVVAALYLVLLIWMQVHHEPWRDELHSWALAQIADGFWDLVTGDRRYEGHPPLWFWYLRLWGRLSPEVWGLQVATVAAAVGAAVLLLRFAPFPRYLKVMLLTTYDFGYEFSVSCRNYVLGWLMLCAFCSLYHPLRQRPLTLAVVLSLMSLSSVYGLIFAVALVIFLVLDSVRLRRDATPAQVVVAALPRQIAAAVVAAAGLAFCAWSVQPMDPNPFSPAWNFAALEQNALADTLNRVLDGLTALRPFTADYWFHPRAYWEQIPEAIPYVAGAMLLASAAVLYRSWRVLAFYLASIVMIALVQQARYAGSPRHWANYFVVLVPAFWLLRTLVPRARHLPSLILLVVLCAFQAEGFVAATVMDTRVVFSGGRDAAAFIRRAGMQDLPLVAGPGQALSVAVYLRRPFYNMETEEVEQTVSFNTRRKGFSATEFLAKAIEVSRDQKSPVTVVINQPLPPTPAGVKSRLLFTSKNGTITDEVFRVYSLDAR